MASGRRIAGAIKSGLQLECARVLYESLLVPVLTYGREAMRCKEKEISCVSEWIVPNPQKRELWGLKKGMDERIDKGVLRRFNHVERMENDRNAKVYAVAQWVGQGRGGTIPRRTP